MNFNENQFISDHLLNILIVAKKVEDISEGYYNIMMGKVSSELGFAPDFEQNISQKEISNYELNESDKSLRRYSENWFDLSSIAKGYAVQQIHEYLYSNNLRNHLIDIGGEIIVNGSKNGSPWSIGIQDPTSNYESSSTVIDNKNNNFLGIATSGEYRNYKIGLNGEKISHTINPRTLKSIENNTLSITVVDKSSVTYADAYATAFNAMGMEKAINIANKNEIAIMIIYDDGYGQDITYSNKWYDLGL
jgi:thiamine biosynthesis lipoprotein